MLAEGLGSTARDFGSLLVLESLKVFQRGAGTSFEAFVSKVVGHCPSSAGRSHLGFTGQFSFRLKVFARLGRTLVPLKFPLGGVVLKVMWHWAKEFGDPLSCGWAGLIQDRGYFGRVLFNDFNGV